MAIDRKVLTEVCRFPSGAGHCLASLQKEVIRDTRTGELIPQFQILCIKCGATLEELGQDFRASVPRAKRKEKVGAPALSSPPPPMADTPAAVDEL